MVTTVNILLIDRPQYAHPASEVGRAWDHAFALRIETSGKSAVAEDFRRRLRGLEEFVATATTDTDMHELAAASAALPVYRARVQNETVWAALAEENARFAEDQVSVPWSRYRAARGDLEAIQSGRRYPQPGEVEKLVGTIRELIGETRREGGPA